MIDWNEAQVFARVVRWMSITRAAAELDVPKSTVSRAVTRLENRTGLQLLERTTRRLRLTAAGQEYAETVRQMEELMVRAESQFSRVRGKPTGLLRVSVPVTFLRTFLAPMLPDFLAQHADLRLEFVQPQPGQEVDVQLRAGALPEDSTMAFRRLGEIAVAVFASPAYLRLAGVPNKPEDLASHAVIALQRQMPWRFTKGKYVVDVAVRARVAVADPVVHVALASQALGVAILPEWLAQPELKAGRLERVLGDYTLAPVELLALFSAGARTLPKVRVFLDHLQDHLSQMRVEKHIERTHAVSRNQIKKHSSNRIGSKMQ
jgi:DNA-binding transcriptional LysR family regulator